MRNILSQTQCKGQIVYTLCIHCSGASVHSGVYGVVINVFQCAISVSQCTPAVYVQFTLALGLG